MFLKSIDLFGFKSFADKSHIEFTNGISALVGPNGCGKSNVVDAVKWVLGEQATKSLRAERMEDVIFNGTDSRKALNVAEVTLTLENNGVLPLDIPEISVKRRLFRSGDSEYFINNTPVKLKELRELFYDTGIGKSAYSIMEQGKIDQIISTKPEDRRSLFEEAAGITRYKMRGREADRKLERTEGNMQEVQNILHEVKRSYDNLERQAQKTSRYRELREELFATEVRIQVWRLNRLRKEQSRQEESVESMNSKREATRAEIDRLNEQLESEVDRVNEMESRLVEIQKQLYGLDLERTSRNERIQLIREQRDELNRKIERDRDRVSRIAEKITQLTESRNEALDSVHRLEAQISDLDATIADIRERIERSVARRKENSDLVKKHEARITANESRVHELQVELRTATDELVDALDAKLKESGYSAAARHRAEEAVYAALGELRITIDGRKETITDHLRVEDGSKPETIEFTEKSLSEIARVALRLEERFTEYQDTIPRFLDDFLAPEGVITRKRTLDEAIITAQLENRELRAKIQGLHDENQRLQTTIDTERSNLEQLNMNRVQLKSQVENHRHTAGRLERELLEQQQMAIDLEHQGEKDHERGAALDSQVTRLREELTTLAEREKTLRKETKDLESNIAGNNRNLKEEETRLKQHMQELAKNQDRYEQARISLAEKRTEIRTLYDGFQERHGRDLHEFEDQDVPEEEGKDLRENAAALREELRVIGNVNLMAPEEFAQVKERFDFLTAQLEDLRKARDDLKHVTAEIRRESEELFIDTYNRIRKNFHSIFRRLFGGGRAELRLTDGENVLDSGIDILVQPPGKKLENIALLSGGERSLTAVALLFATFMVRPSPFTLLDEIDAALDEHNVTRFVTMLHEFSEQSQFVVITHNKKTVAGANTFLGVTMEESGVSKVVTVKVDDRVEQNV